MASMVSPGPTRSTRSPRCGGGLDVRHVDGDEVHRHAPDDRARVVPRMPTTGRAWPAGAYGPRDSRRHSPRRPPRCATRAPPATSPSSRRSRPPPRRAPAACARDRDHGAHRRRPAPERLSAVERIARPHEIVVIGRAEHQSVGGGEAGAGLSAAARAGRSKTTRCASFLGDARIVGGGEVAHDEADVEPCQERRGHGMSARSRLSESPRRLRPLSTWSAAGSRRSRMRASADPLADLLDARKHRDGAGPVEVRPAPGRQPVERENVGVGTQRARRPRFVGRGDEEGAAAGAARAPG